MVRPDRILSVLALLVLLISCSEKQSAVISQVPGTQLPRKVAILPFSNHSHAELAGPTVRKMFYNFFSSLNYIDIEPYQVDSSLKKAGLFDDVANGHPASVQRLCQALGADALVLGDVTTIGKIYAVLYSEVRAGLKARMITCPTGKIIWENKHTSHIAEGGISISPLGLASTAARVILNLRQTIGMRVVSDLCMEMTSTIPNPPAVFPPGPEIKVLVHNGAYRLLTPGDRLKVAMVGRPGMNASWEISPGMGRMKMAEKQPGIYSGMYTVKREDRIISGQIIGYLENNKGGRSRWLDVLGPVTLATPTPLPPVVKGQLSLDERSSPYIIRDTLLIGSGDRLDMGPGISIWVEGLGIIVQGSLSISGSSARPVHMAASTDHPWKGIVIDSPSGRIEINHLSLTGADRGITAKKAHISMKDSSLSENSWGIVLDECDAVVSNSVIVRTEKTGISMRRSRVEIKGSDIVENGGGGILVNESSAAIHHCNITNNGGWNLKVMDEHSTVDAENNWWGMGSGDAGALKVIGPAILQPVLGAPVRRNLAE